MSKQAVLRALAVCCNNPVSGLLALLGALSGCVVNTEPLAPLAPDVGPAEGTADYLAKFTPMQQLAPSLVIERDKGIGIGTSSPAARLHVGNMIPDSGLPNGIRLDAAGTTAGSRDFLFRVTGATSAYDTLMFFSNSETGKNDFGGAPPLAIHADGRVGVGTASMSAKLEVRGFTPNAELKPDDGPALVAGFYAEGASGHAGYLSILGTNVGGSDSVALASQQHAGTGLVLATRDGSGTHARLTITGDGRVGIGTTTAQAPLHVDGNIRTSSDLLADYDVKAGRSVIAAGGSCMCGSSRTLKERIRDLDGSDAVAALQRLRPSRFAYKTAPDEEKLGFIAEDVPDLVAQKDRKTLDAMEFTALLTRVVQEQQKRLAAQDARIERLEAALARRQARP